MTPLDRADDAERQTQLLRGVLDMCMLALLAEAPAHGYDLVRRLNAAGLDTVGYGTVYPLLTRMRRLGLVVDDVQDSPAGPPRRVYALTDAGRQTLAGWSRQWHGFVDTINATLTDVAAPTRSSER